MMILVNWLVPTLKNYSQRLKQILAGWFPSVIRGHYFDTLEQAIAKFPHVTSGVENEIVFLSYVVPEDAVVFDVGANRGDYLYALTRDSKARTIYAFEPIPELATQLRKLFPKVNVREMALSDQEGHLRFSIPFINNRYFDTRGTLEQFVEENQTKSRMIEVEVSTLDAFCKKNKISKIDFLKIDVEGHEWAVLKGAKETLSTLRPLCLVEIEQRHHEHLPIQEIVSWVEALGYEAYYYNLLSNHFLSFQTFNVKEHQDARQLTDRKVYVNNFFFIPKEQIPAITSTFNMIVEKRNAVKS
jgi:FkbM family methyltransferase